MIIPGLIQTVLTEPSITGLIGQNITPVQLPENSPLPAVTMQIVGGQSKPTLTTTGLQKTRVQIDCFGETYLEADTVRTALILFLNGNTATLASGIRIHSIQLVQMIELPYEWQSEIFRLAFEVYAFWNFPPAS